MLAIRTSPWTVCASVCGPPPKRSEQDTPTCNLTNQAVGGLYFFAGGMLIENKSYIVWRMVLFSDGHGFILSKNVRSHNFYITLQFVQENGRPRCYRGGYHGDPQEAHQDFRQRVKDYQL